MFSSYEHGPSAAVRVLVLPPVLTFSPTAIKFSDQLTGTSSEPQKVTVINSSSAPLNIMNIAASDDFAASDNCVPSSPLPVGKGCTIEVRFTPSGAGPRNGKLTIGNAVNVAPPSVSLTGLGLPAVPNLAVAARTGTEGNTECTDSTGIPAPQ